MSVPGSRSHDYSPLRGACAAASAPVCPKARELGLPISSGPCKGRDVGHQEWMPSPNFPRWGDFFSQDAARPLSKYLSLDTVQTPKPEDLASA